MCATIVDQVLPALQKRLKLYFNTSDFFASLVYRSLQAKATNCSTVASNLGKTLDPENKKAHG